MKCKQHVLSVMVLVFFISPVACRTTRPKSQALALTSITKDRDSKAIYMGYSKPEGQNYKILTQFDVIETSLNENAMTYLGVVKFILSSEHEISTLNLTIESVPGGSLKGKTNSENIRVERVNLTDDLVTMTLFSVRENKTLEVRLINGDSSSRVANLGAIFSDAQVTSGFKGHYKGDCNDGAAWILSIDTGSWRGSESTGLDGNFTATARLGKAEGGICSPSEYCIRELLGFGQYTPFSNSLVFKGTSSGELSRKDNLLSYKNCKFAAPVQNITLPSSRVSTIPRVVHSESKQNDHSYSGQYYGYLLHEATGLNQLIALNIKSEKLKTSDEKTGYELAAVATAYFGDGDSGEFIAYKFDSTSWNGVDPLTLNGKGEAFLVVNSIKQGIVRGVWFGKTYGYAGQFILQLGSVPTLEEGKIFSPLAGIYQSPEWQVEIVASPNISEDSADPYPLKISGVAKETSDSSRRRSIIDGTYDFYRQQVSLRLDDGRLITGQIKDKSLELNWPSQPRHGGPLSQISGIFQKLGFEKVTK